MVAYYCNYVVRIIAILCFSKIIANLNTSWSILFFDFCIKILQQCLLKYYVSTWKGDIIFNFCNKTTRGWFDVLRGRLLGNHNDFHWQLGGQINHQPCSYKAARVIRCTELDSAVSSF